jgi:NAD(P)H-hydrate epimerase
MHELLTTQEMAEADRRAVALGVPSLTLMENAGRVVADEAEKMTPRGSKVIVMCGPGNNGGDGFVAARHLKERGYDVRVAGLVPVERLKGDAAVMARRWGVSAGAVHPSLVEGAALIIDALFGAGLDRPLSGAAADAITHINAARAQGVPILAVDVPSGLGGTTGNVIGDAVVVANRTVTFFRKKPGHLLMPGRPLCGDVVVADIGIPSAVLAFPLEGEVSRSDGGGADIGGSPPAGPSGHLPLKGGGEADGLSKACENAPLNWRDVFPSVRAEGHKYTRGHALVVSGPVFQSGAARMSARGALRIGAGLVTVASPTSALPENAAHLTAIMLKPCPSARALAEILEDKRKNAVVIGPGAGVGEDTRELVLAALKSGAACVLDADALTSFAQKEDEGAGSVGFGFTGAVRPTSNYPETLFAAIRRSLLPLGRRSPEGGDEGAVHRDGHDSPPTPTLSPRGEGAVVLTPHEGEFKRLFGDVASAGASKLERARAAAKLSGAIVVLKGPDTVIAAPDGVAAINANAPATLATAGSGDVLAGFIGGLLAQGMPAFEAACAAVWLHGECANVFGPGLIAEDLPEVLPQVLKRLGSA